MRILSLVVYLAFLSTSGAAAAPEGTVAGRLVFSDGSRQLTFQEVEGKLSERITIELRHGARIVEAKVDPDGYFVVSGPPGRYRLEYLSIGERAEFIQPQELGIEADAMTCAGTVSVRILHFEKLGANQENSISVTDNCEVLWPRLRELASGGTRQRVMLARTGALIENPKRKNIFDYAAREMSLEWVGAHGVGMVRATVIHPFSWSGVSPSVYASAGVLVREGQGFELTGGAGLNLFIVDLLLVAGFRLSSSPEMPGGPVFGAYGRSRFLLGPFGLGVRYDLVPNNQWAAVIEFPLFLFLGMLL